MTYTVDGGDSRPVTSHQNLTTCSGVPVELSVCVPTARPGSLLSLKVKGQTISSSQTCVRVFEKFSSSQPLIFSFDEEEFVFNVKVDACVSRNRRSSTWRSRSPSMSWSNSGSMPWANRGQSTSRLRDSALLPLDLSYMTCPRLPVRQPDYLSNGIRVLCDTVTDGGNWIVIQRRTTGEVDFYRNWVQYVSGFGEVTGDHWLGLENIHTLCPPSRPCILRVDLKDPQYNNGQVVWAEYSSFSLKSYSDNYRLSISGYDAKSTAGDGFIKTGSSTQTHNGMQFSTKDKDNDKDSGRNCAVQFHGAWWYNACFYSNLNGEYGVREEKGMKWYGVKQLYATYTEMKIRVLG